MDQNTNSDFTTYTHSGQRELTTFFFEMPQIQSSAPSATVFYQHLQFFNRFSEKKPVWDAE